MSSIDTNIDPEGTFAALVLLTKYNHTVPPHFGVFICVLYSHYLSF